MPDGVMAVCQERDLELGADAVRARDEHGLLVFFEREQPAEAADMGHYFRPECGFYVGFYLLDEEVPGIDVDAGVFVSDCHGIPFRNFLHDSTCNGDRLSTSFKQVRIAAFGHLTFV